MPVSFIWELDINSLSLSFFFLFWFCFGCGILLLQPGIKPMSLTIGSLESPPLDHQRSPQTKCNQNLSYIVDVLSSSQDLPMDHNDVGAFSFLLLPCDAPSGVYISQVFRSLNCHGRKLMNALFKDISPLQNEPCKKKEMYNTRCWIINDDISGTSERKIGVSVNFAHIPPNNIMLVRSIMTIESRQPAINFRKPASDSP